MIRFRAQALNLMTTKRTIEERDVGAESLPEVVRCTILYWLAKRCEMIPPFFFYLLVALFTSLEVQHSVLASTKGIVAIQVPSFCLYL
jgi:hypothetical protein